MVKLFSWILVLVLVSLPFVAAYNGQGYSYFSPSQILENEWIVFALIFVGCFAIIYFALERTMKGNRGAVVVIAIVISLFLAVAVSQKTRYYGYLGSAIGGWLFIILIVIIFLFLIKLLMGAVGLAGLLIVLWGVWILMRFLDPYEILPYEFLTSGILNVYEILAGWLSFIILVIITLVILLSPQLRRKLWGGSRDRVEIRW